MNDTKDQEVHIICINRCQEVDRDAVKALILELVGPARAEDGCLYYDVYQQTDNLDAFVLLDGWVNQAAVDAHVKHPNVAGVMNRLTPLLSEPPQLTFTRRISER